MCPLNLVIARFTFLVLQLLKEGFIGTVYELTCFPLLTLLFANFGAHIFYSQIYGWEKMIEEEVITYTSF